MIHSIEYFMNSIKMSLQKCHRIFYNNSIDFFAKGCTCDRHPRMISCDIALQIRPQVFEKGGSSIRSQPGICEMISENYYN